MLTKRWCRGYSILKWSGHTGSSMAGSSWRDSISEWDWGSWYKRLSVLWMNNKLQKQENMWFCSYNHPYTLIWLARLSRRVKDWPQRGHTKGFLGWSRSPFLSSSPVTDEPRDITSPKPPGPMINWVPSSLRSTCKSSVCKDMNLQSQEFVCIQIKVGSRVLKWLDCFCHSWRDKDYATPYYREWSTWGGREKKVHLLESYCFAPVNSLICVITLSVSCTTITDSPWTCLSLARKN